MRIEKPICLTPLVCDGRLRWAIGGSLTQLRGFSRRRGCGHGTGVVVRCQFPEAIRVIFTRSHTSRDPGFERETDSDADANLTESRINVSSGQSYIDRFRRHILAHRMGCPLYSATRTRCVYCSFSTIPRASLTFRTPDNVSGSHSG